MEIYQEEMSTISKLQQYLSQRPIAPIFAKLKEHEKNDEIALKFMCVIDYEATRIDLYARINGTNFPKLLHELLGFQSYTSFTYYDYSNNYCLRGNLLQCQFAQCQFIGPYTLTLTHMAVNHNMDVGSIICAYCHEKTLKDHLFVENSLAQCYKNYLLANEIPDVDSGVHLIVVDFYEMLKECSKKLEVCTTRHLYRYVAKPYGQSEQLGRKYGNGLSRSIFVYQPKRKTKQFSIDKLNEEFISAMGALYDGDPNQFNVVGSIARRILKMKIVFQIR